MSLVHLHLVTLVCLLHLFLCVFCCAFACLVWYMYFVWCMYVVCVCVACLYCVYMSYVMYMYMLFYVLSVCLSGNIAASFYDLFNGFIILSDYYENMTFLYCSPQAQSHQSDLDNHTAISSSVESNDILIFGMYSYNICKRN